MKIKPVVRDYTPQEIQQHIFQWLAADRDVYKKTHREFETVGEWKKEHPERAAKLAAVPDYEIIAILSPERIAAYNEIAGKKQIQIEVI